MKIYPKTTDEALRVGDFSIGTTFGHDQELGMQDPVAISGTSIHMQMTRASVPADGDIRLNCCTMGFAICQVMGSIHDSRLGELRFNFLQATANGEKINLDIPETLIDSKERPWGVETSQGH